MDQTIDLEGKLRLYRNRDGTFFVSIINLKGEPIMSIHDRLDIDTGDCYEFGPFKIKTDVRFSK